MKHLRVLRKYFYKYRFRLILGVIFVVLANVFAVIAPVIVRNVLDEVYQNIQTFRAVSDASLKAPMLRFVMRLVMYNGLLLLAFALLRGFFMFMMRQTIIVMSRHIEFDQKNEVFAKYQSMDTAFFKANATGDLMSRIAEDVSRVRMYTGPAIMYTINLTVLIIMSVWGMLRVNAELTLYVLLPLPFLAFTMYKVNALIHHKSEAIQKELGKLTSFAQESYAGIRVVKSFVLENVLQQRFSQASKSYRGNTIKLAKLEAFYFPTMTFFIGLSTLLIIYIGGLKVIQHQISVGNIAEFIMYITMLTFPVSALGWTSSMIQRAAASQKRLNEFLSIEPSIDPQPQGFSTELKGNIEFRNVRFVYPQTGIEALSNFSFKIAEGDKVVFIGKTGSGKSSVFQLLLRMYDVTEGEILVEGVNVKAWNLQSLRRQMAFVPQEVFLFSDTVEENISFGANAGTEVSEAARAAAIDKDLQALKDGYDTMVGERGVMLSGGQKQRVSLARALIKKARVVLLDDTLSAVDNATQQEIISSFRAHPQTMLIASHRIFPGWENTRYVVLKNGQIAEEGMHEALMAKNGYYNKLFKFQNNE